MSPAYDQGQPQGPRAGPGRRDRGVTTPTYQRSWQRAGRTVRICCGGAIAGRPGWRRTGEGAAGRQEALSRGPQPGRPPASRGPQLLGPPASRDAHACTHLHHCPVAGPPRDGSGSCCCKGKGAISEDRALPVARRPCLPQPCFSHSATWFVGNKMAPCGCPQGEKRQPVFPAECSKLPADLCQTGSLRCQHTPHPIPDSFSQSQPVPTLGTQVGPRLHDLVPLSCVPMGGRRSCHHPQGFSCKQDTSLKVSSGEAVTRTPRHGAEN